MDVGRAYIAREYPGVFFRDGRAIIPAKQAEPGAAVRDLDTGLFNFVGPGALDRDQGIDQEIGFCRGRGGVLDRSGKGDGDLSIAGGRSHRRDLIAFCTKVGASDPEYIAYLGLEAGHASIKGHGRRLGGLGHGGADLEEIPDLYPVGETRKTIRIVGIGIGEFRRRVGYGDRDFRGDMILEIAGGAYRLLAELHLFDQAGADQENREHAGQQERADKGRDKNFDQGEAGAGVRQAGKGKGHRREGQEIILYTAPRRCSGSRICYPLRSWP
jgi:hypothetical protein